MLANEGRDFLWAIMVAANATQVMAAEAGQVVIHLF